MNLAHTHLTSNYIPGKDYYIFRSSSEYVIILLLVCLIANPFHAKTVFYSKRDGNAEIYTMDSDGDNQTQLTFNGEGENWAA